jgi:hypothetical protein
MRQVYFIGSGFSIDVGYPSNKKLLDKIGEEARDNREVRVRHAWNRFEGWVEKFRHSEGSPIRAIFESSNPELILTIPDLLVATLEENDLNIFEDLREARSRNDESAIHEINMRWEHPLREKLTECQLVIEDFQLLLDYFFSYKHCRDSKLTSTEKWGYVHNGMKVLEEGDIVITTNWDTIAERTLMEQRKWFPSDGYGFQVNILCGPEFNPQPLPYDLTKPSQVKVLKLHGSIGWCSLDDNNSICLRSANYLQHLHPEGMVIWDVNEQNAVGSHENFVFVGPSYLKKLKGPIIQSIWQQATEAISTAEQVAIVGYSLPYADISVRVLLNVLQKRLSEGSVKVKVVDPDKSILNWWRDFLGPKMEPIKEKAEEFFNKGASKCF